VNNNCVGGQYKGEYADAERCQENCQPDPPGDTPGACCSYLSSPPACSEFAAGSVPGANELACVQFGGVFFANKTCAEVNCSLDACCCGIGISGVKGCQTCFFPQIKTLCGGCFDFNGDPLTPTPRDECEGGQP
jgi:hypothetical protein